jgi:putative PEP-CTERM system histidine kinase
MPISAVLSYAAAYFSLIVTLGVLLRDKHSFVHRTFGAGMLLLAAAELFRGMSYGAVSPGDAVYWQRRVMATSAVLPAVWLAFSVTYARADAAKFLAQWKWAIIGIAVVPMTFLAIFRKSFFVGAIYLPHGDSWSILLNWPGRAWQAFVICSSLLILFNLERTVRSSTGRIRWQIKFTVLALGLLFALRIYLASQQLLFSTIDSGAVSINGVALIAANVLFAISLLRGSALNLDLYVSTAAIQNSLTIILAGVYLLVVGVLARAARYLSSSESLPLDSFVVFISLTALTVLLLSNRLRRKLRLFVSRHFSRPLYDYRKVWMQLTQRTISLVDQRELSTAISRIVSESLEILSVSVWVVDDSQRRLRLAGSTAFPQTQAKALEKAGKSAPEFIRFVSERLGCLDLEQEDLAWPKEIMQAEPNVSGESRMQYAVGLHAGGEFVGIMTLNNDRVGRQPLSHEDIALVETLATQLASSLLNLKLSAQLRQAKEVETFQTVSTFFVHDLKNLASRLSLTMQNLPANYDNPEFRADALRVISNSVSKIDDMCTRLSMLKQDIELHLNECDLTALIATTLDEFKANLKAELRKDLQPLPKALVDSEQLHKVLTNLVINANEAVNGSGIIQVTTIHEGNTVGFAVRDNGIGMSEEFVEKSLFKPFQTTKKKGLGIGLFHSKLIVEAHHGRLEVNSAPGAGTEFRVLIPVAGDERRTHRNVPKAQRVPKVRKSISADLTPPPLRAHQI